MPWSPCFHYLDWHWRHFLARMGLPFELAMPMAGFYPQGGGEVLARVPGGAHICGLKLQKRGPLRRVLSLSAVANLLPDTAERQRKQALKRLSSLAANPDIRIETSRLPAPSPGTVLLVLAEFEHTQACFFTLGRRENPPKWSHTRR